MTTIITRVFRDSAAAHRAADRLQFKGVPKGQLTIIETAENAQDRLTRARVHETAVAPYQKQLAAGNTVMVVRTTYKPLGAARITREEMDTHDTIDTGSVVDDFFAKSTPEKATSVLKNHPHMLTLRAERPRGLVSPMFGLRLLKPHRTNRTLMDPNKRMSRMFWPMPLVKRKTKRNSAISGGKHMSKMFWPMPLLSNAPRRKSVIPGGGVPFSRALGLSTTT